MADAAAVVVVAAGVVVVAEAVDAVVPVHPAHVHALARADVLAHAARRIRALSRAAAPSHAVDAQSPSHQSNRVLAHVRVQSEYIFPRLGLKFNSNN